MNTNDYSFLQILRVWMSSISYENVIYGHNIHNIHILETRQ
jgi:hypothetical protein